MANLDKATIKRLMNMKCPLFLRPARASGAVACKPSLTAAERKYINDLEKVSEKHGVDIVKLQIRAQNQKEFTKRKKGEL